MKRSLWSVVMCVCFCLCAHTYGQNPPADKPPSQAPPSPMVMEEDLRRAIQSSGGSEPQLIANLEAYLKKYPYSERRNEIENEIFKMCVKLRDYDRAIRYGEKMLTDNDTNIEVLTSTVTVLRDRHAEGDLNKALLYADKLVKSFETLLTESSKPRRISAAQWEDRKQQGLASVYLLRGRVHADLGNLEKAQADLQKSFKAARLAGAAVSLAEVAEKRKDTDLAIENYAQGFVISLITDETIDKAAVRRKLGQLYTAKKGSETGLGDLLLKTYDNVVKERNEHLAKLEAPNINEGLADAMQFTLTKLDGSRLKMSEQKGKVIVLNFWATWCGPCLTEMPLFEKTMAKYKDDKDVVFLAVTTDEDRELVSPFLKQHKFNLPVAYAEHLDDLFAVASIPTTIILDRNGQIAFRQAGFNPREDFVESLSARIEEAKKK